MDGKVCKDSTMWIGLTKYCPTWWILEIFRPSFCTFRWGLWDDQANLEQLRWRHHQEKWWGYKGFQPRERWGIDEVRYMKLPSNLVIVMVELGRSYDSPKQNMSLMPWCHIAHTILLEVVQPAVSSADFVATVANVLMTRRATVPIVGSHWHGGKVAARPFLVDAIIDESSQGKTGKWKMTENVIWYVWWKCQCCQQLVFVAIPKNQHAIS